MLFFFALEMLFFFPRPAPSARARSARCPLTLLALLAQKYLITGTKVPKVPKLTHKALLEMLGASYMYGPIRALAVRSLSLMPDAGSP
jgi:hypothetical protein